MLLRNNRREKPVIWFATAILVIGTIAFACFLMRGRLSRYLTSKSTEFLSKSLKTKITAREIKGNIFSGLSLSEVKINFSSGDSFYANTVKAEYDLISIIWKGKNNIRNIKIVQPVIYLKQEAGSRMQEARKSHASYLLRLASDPMLPLLFINRLEIQEGSVYSNGTLILDTFSIITRINLHASGAQVLINSSSFYIPDKTVKIDNVQGTVELGNNLLRLQNIRIKSSPISINFDGWLDLIKRNIDLDIKKGHLNLKPLSGQAGEIEIDGKVSVYFLSNTWTISNIKSNLDYRTSNLLVQKTIIPDGKGKIIFSDTTFKANYSSLNTAIANESQLKVDAYINFNPFSYRGKAAFVNFQFPIKNLEMPVDGEADFRGITTDSVDINLIASIKKPEIESISAQVKIRKGRLLLEKFRIKDHTSILNVDGDWQLSNGHREFTGNFRFTNFSLYLLSEVFRVFGFSDISLEGFLSGNCNIRSNGSSIASSGKVHIRKGHYADLLVEKLALEYDIENIKTFYGNVVFTTSSLWWRDNKLDRISFSLNQKNFLLKINNWKENSLIAYGELQSNNKDIDCLVDSIEVTNTNYTLKNKQRFSFGKKDTQLYLKDFSLAIGNGTLSLDIIKNLTGQPKVNLTCNQISLEDISNILKLKTPLRGIVNLDINSLENFPYYNINLSGYDLNIPTALFPSQSGNRLQRNQSINNHSDISLKFLRVSCTLKDSLFAIDNINMVYHMDTSEIYGTVFVSRKIIEENPFDLNITFADPGPWVFFFLKNILEFQEGRIYGQGKLTGSLKKPVLSGGVRISDGKLFIVSTKTICNNVNAEISFEHQKIILKNLTGKTGTGRIYGQGFTEFAKLSQVDTLSYKIEFQDTPLRPENDVFAIASGHLNIDYKPGNKTRLTTPLSLSGDIRIKEALLTFEFKSSTSLSSSSNQSALGGLDLNLKIVGERDIWLRNRNTDIELSADLNIFTSDGTTIYSGQLEAIQGNFYYLDHSLKLFKGLLVFDNISELDPDLNISAELTTRPIEVRPGHSERVKIILNLTGRLKEPNFHFMSDPSYLSENDIVSYLTFNVTWQELSTPELRQRFTTALSGKLLGYFERELTKRLRNMIFLDYLCVESGLISGAQAKVTVGKYISPNLYFTYEYDISGNVYDIFRLEYNFTKSHGIIGEHDLEGRYNLKYQYKIRY